MPQSFIETTFYDENNNNQVWSHHWGIVESTSKRTNKNEAVPVNVSFKWVDGKIVNASWIFDPSIKIQEIMASQKQIYAVRASFFWTNFNGDWEKFLSHWSPSKGAADIQ